MIPDKTACFDGFENIPRRWNTSLGKYVANVVPGEFYVTMEDEGVTTILGSCVSCCIRDRNTGIGGLNHFMLPATNEKQEIAGCVSNIGKAGDWAMEFLINAILLNGGNREDLEVKVFGGAQMIPGLKNVSIGKQNIEFVKSYLEREHLEVLSSDLGGDPPRKIMFFPQTGKVKLKRLPLSSSQQILSDENKYGGSLVTHDLQSGSIDLF